MAVLDQASRINTLVLNLIEPVVLDASIASLRMSVARGTLGHFAIVGQAKLILFVVVEARSTPVTRVDSRHAAFFAEIQLANRVNTDVLSHIVDETLFTSVAL